MAVDNVSGIPTYTNGVKVEPAGKTQELGQGDFLRLLTTQLQNQDPFAPMDGTQMLGQMAQFSNVTGIAEMNSTLKQIQTQLSEQGQVLKSLMTPAPSDASTDSTTNNA